MLLTPALKRDDRQEAPCDWRRKREPQVQAEIPPQRHRQRVVRRGHTPFSSVLCVWIIDTHKCIHSQTLKHK